MQIKCELFCLENEAFRWLEAMLMSFSGMVAWQGRYCALSYNSFSMFMKHVFSQVSRAPCDMHDCFMCTAESHHDFNHLDERMTSVVGASIDTPLSTYRNNFFPQFDASTKSKKDIKKRMRLRQRGASSTATEKSPRILALQHHAKSTTPRFDNPYEEEFIQEIFTPRGKNKKDKALFPYIPQSPPLRSRRIRISAGPSINRRTISAPGVETNSLRTLLSK